MNTGKEPFKCGIRNAECGMRLNLISVIAKLRAPSHATRSPSFEFGATNLPLRHSECGFGVLGHVRAWVRRDMSRRRKRRHAIALQILRLRRGGGFGARDGRAVQRGWRFSIQPVFGDLFVFQPHHGIQHVQGNRRLRSLILAVLKWNGAVAEWVYSGTAFNAPIVSPKEMSFPISVPTRTEYPAVSDNPLV